MHVVVGVIGENVLQIQARVSGVVTLDTLPEIVLLRAHMRILLLVHVMVEVVVWELRILFKDNRSILVQLLAIVLRVPSKPQ